MKDLQFERGEILSLLIIPKVGGTAVDLRGTQEGIPQEIRIDGTAVGAGLPVDLQIQEDFEGRPQWYDDFSGWQVYWDGTRWIVEHAVEPFYEWRGAVGGAGDVASPDLVPLWTPQPGTTGTITVVSLTSFSNGYDVDAWIKSDTTGRVRESMNPAITQEELIMEDSEGDPLTVPAGSLQIAYDTINLCPGNYQFDIRFSQGGTDLFTVKKSVRINGTITPPTPR
jgi:hypothetical protein